MDTRLRFAFAATLISCVVAVSAYAQELSSPAPAPAPGNLAFVEGSVHVVQSGVSEPADPPQMLFEGDSVRTRDGRAEIVFGDGSLLHLSDDTELEILGEERLRLTMGRVIVRMSHAAGRPYVFDTPAASVRLEAQGEYELNAERSGRLRLAVARGSASVEDAQEWTIRGGQMITLRGPGVRPLIEPFNSARWDAFEEWSNDRATGFSTSISAAQLPYELRPYAPVLDEYGRWDYVAPHGYVWFPSVGGAWRPYYEGAWSFTRYGWTWHGQDRWAWPTHHYGRWGFTGASWYWIPATVWAPAWVTWSVAAGYVSWAPLGWHSTAYYDPWGRRDHPAYRPHYSPWRGWTVVPRHSFGPRRNVRAHAVDGDRLDEGTRRTLISQAPAPRVVEDVAVPRESVTRPGARGNVRRPPPAAPAYPPRAYSPPVATTTGGADRRMAPTGDGDGRPAPAGEADRGVESGHGAVRRVAPAGAADQGSDARSSERRGGDRAPSAMRPAPRQEPRNHGGAAATQQRSGESSGGGAVRAVPRNGTSRGDGGSSQSAPAQGSAPAGGARRRGPG